MSEVQLTVTVPKEVNDLRTALVTVIQDVKAGQNLVQMLSNLSVFVTAIAGVTAIPDDVKSDLTGSLQVAGLFAADVVGVLLAPKA